MPNTLRRLNPAGIEAFSSYLQGLPNNTKSLPPSHLLVDGNYSEQIEKSVEVENRSFHSQFKIF